MKKTLTSLMVTLLFSMGAASADMGKGLNVTITSADRQTQMMAMVLSVMTMKKHKKAVNVVFCGPASDLALKTTKTETFKPSDKSPTMLLNALLKMGATVEVCPLFLPSTDKAAGELIDGITVAKPPKVAARLLDMDYRSLTF